VPSSFSLSVSNIETARSFCHSFTSPSLIGKSHSDLTQTDYNTYLISSSRASLDLLPSALDHLSRTLFRPDYESYTYSTLPEADLLVEMKNKATIVTLTAACASTVLGKAQLINGNWYDSAVERIIFTDWGQAGTYNKITDMSDGRCVKEEVSFSGGMSPLDGEVSFAPITSCRVC